MAVYERHNPESTVLYQSVARAWPEIEFEYAISNQNISPHVTAEFNRYRRCGILWYQALVRIKLGPPTTIPTPPTRLPPASHHPARHQLNIGSRGPNFFAKPWVSIQRSAPAAQEWWSMMPSPRQRRLPRCSQDWGSSPRAHPQSGSRRENLIMSLMSKCWC